MVMPGRSFIGSPQYRYTFQGQENDAETKWNAFELRMYDGRKARWDAPDLFRQYHSPYLAMGNNPMRFIDPLGGQDEPQTGANDPIYALFGYDDPHSVGGSLSPQYSNEEEAYEDIERNYWEGNTGFTQETRTRYKWTLDPQSGGGINAWRRSSEIYTYNRRIRSTDFFASLNMDRRFAGLEEEKEYQKIPWGPVDLGSETVLKDLKEAYRYIYNSGAYGFKQKEIIKSGSKFKKSTFFRMWDDTFSGPYGIEYMSWNTNRGGKLDVEINTKEMEVKSMGFTTIKKNGSPIGFRLRSVTGSIMGEFRFSNPQDFNDYFNYIFNNPY